jgi:hypothetical protein
MKTDEILALLGDIQCNHDQYGYLTLDVQKRLKNAIAALEKQINNPVFQKLKDKGLISEGCSMDEINKQIEQPEESGLFEITEYGVSSISDSPYEGKTTLRPDSPLNVPEKPVFISDEGIEKELDRRLESKNSEDRVGFREGAKWMRNKIRKGKGKTLQST